MAKNEMVFVFRFGYFISGEMSEERIRSLVLAFEVRQCMFVCGYESKQKYHL